MTRTQIQNILSEFNTEFSTSGTLYGENIWMDMTEISKIILVGNELIYPDETLQVQFNGDTQLILLRSGYYNSEDIWVTVSNFAAIGYNQVLGFMMSMATSTKSSYQYPSTI